jgi:predicted metalloprotease with PDZ domain
LDHLMREMLARYPLPRGYTLDDFRETASALAGAATGEWIRQAFETTTDLDYSPALTWFGLRFRPAPPVNSGWLGAGTRADGEQVAVTQAWRDSPAWRAGLSAGDRILAWNGAPVSLKQFGEKLSETKPGDRVSLRILRHGRIRTLELTLGAAPPSPGDLERDPAAGDAARARYAAWVTSSAAP